MTSGAPPGHAYQSPRSLPVINMLSMTSPAEMHQIVEESVSVQAIFEAYHKRGHLVACLDPLDTFSHLPQLAPSFQLTEQDRDRVFQLPEWTWIGGNNDTSLRLSEIMDRLEVIQVIMFTHPTVNLAHPKMPAKTELNHLPTLQLMPCYSATDTLQILLYTFI